MIEKIGRNHYKYNGQEKKNYPIRRYNHIIYFNGKLKAQFNEILLFLIKSAELEKHSNLENIYFKKKY